MASDRIEAFTRALAQHRWMHDGPLRACETSMCRTRVGILVAGHRPGVTPEQPWWADLGITPGGDGQIMLIEHKLAEDLHIGTAAHAQIESYVGRHRGEARGWAGIPAGTALHDFLDDGQD